MKKTIKTFSLVFIVLLATVTAHAQEGTIAPDFTATDTHGNVHNLYDYLEQGKIVVIDFFYTTCGPCQNYAPQVNKVYERYGCNEGDVFFISVDVNDTDQEVIDYENQFGIEFPSISGIDGGGNDIVSAYGVVGFPTYYVIDSTKRIIKDIDPPTVVVFDYFFEGIGVEPSPDLCLVSTEEEQALASDVTIYPNPAINDEITIELGVDISGPGVLTLFDSQGKKLYTQDVSLTPKMKHSLGQEAQKQGNYLLQIKSKDSNKLVTIPFVKM